MTEQGKWIKDVMGWTGDKNIAPFTGSLRDPNSPALAIEYFTREDATNKKLVETNILSVIDEVVGPKPPESWSREASGEFLRTIGYVGPLLRSHGVILDRVLAAVETGGESPEVEWQCDLLGTLIELGHKGSVDFWLDEWRQLGKRSAVVVANGLALHGIEPYLRWANEIMAKEDEKIDEELEWAISSNIPILIDQPESGGRDCVKASIDTAKDEGRISGKLHTMISEWME